MKSTHGLTKLALVIAALTFAVPALRAQTIVAPASNSATSVNQSQTITVQNQGIGNVCYVPAAAQIAANRGCNLDPTGNPVALDALGNPTGEWVNLAGTITIAYTFTMDADGDHEHMRTTTHSELTGTGACSGAKYVERENFNADYKLTLIATGFMKSDFQQDDKIKLVSQGPLPNMTSVTRTHVIVDEKGNVTITKTFPNAQGQTITKCSK